jgi:hydrogenase maturation protease
MISGLDNLPPSPILVLGLGNTVLSDDGVGPAILESLRRQHGDESRVEFIDGGTQGLSLLGYLSGQRVLIILDAVQLGKPPGAISVLDLPQVQALGAHRATTAHEGNAGELLAAAAILGDLPEQVYVVGVEPERLTTGIGLSDPVQAAVPEAVAQARRLIETALAPQSPPSPPTPE